MTRSMTNALNAPILFREQVQAIRAKLDGKQVNAAMALTDRLLAGLASRRPDGPAVLSRAAVAGRSSAPAGALAAPSAQVPGRVRVRVPVAYLPAPGFDASGDAISWQTPSRPTTLPALSSHGVFKVST